MTTTQLPKAGDRLRWLEVIDLAERIVAALDKHPGIDRQLVVTSTLINFEDDYCIYECPRCDWRGTPRDAATSKMGNACCPNHHGIIIDRDQQVLLGWISGTPTKRAWS